jgi:NADH dehydrogenase
VFIDDIARLAADSLVDPAAANRVFEVGGPETLRMRDIIKAAVRRAGLARPLVPGPAPLIKLAAWPLTLLPTPPLTPDAVDFINQPATVDNGPLLKVMPRQLTPLAEGLGTYLGPADESNAAIVISPAA